MTCREARQLQMDLPHSGEVREHLAGCEECANQFAEMMETVAVIRPRFRMEASAGFKQRVMDKLAEREAPVRRGSWIPRWVLAMAAMLLIVEVLPIIGSLGRRASPSVLTLLAQSAESISKARSVHMIARMRTEPQDNFEYIDPNHDWVPLEIWSEAGPPARWRVEKPGRVAICDGQASMLLIKPDEVARGSVRANYLEWMRILLDPEQLMERELEWSRKGYSEASLLEGGGQTVLTVSRHPRGWFTTNQWGRDRAVSASDHTRVYRFNAADRKLEGMQLVMHTFDGKDIPVFEVTQVRYDERFDAALFALSEPANASHFVDPEEMPIPADGRLPQSPKEAAEMLFDAFARSDWEKARVVYPMNGFNQRFKQAFGGIQVISIGEPFQTAIYPGWFVPYQIRFSNGHVKKWNLAVRNDNSVKRWVEDGGL